MKESKSAPADEQTPLVLSLTKCSNITTTSATTTSATATSITNSTATSQITIKKFYRCGGRISTCTAFGDR